jgi:hypothetical protein
MLDSSAGPAPLPFGEEVAREAAAELAAEEGEHVLGMQAERGVAEQARVEVAQGAAAREQDVGGVLRLVDRPVVAVVREHVAEERVGAARQGVEDRGPLQGREAICEPLSTPGIFEPEEGVLQFPVAEPAVVELAGEPLVAVDVDLDGERAPGLQADMEEAEVRIEEVEVEEEALPPRGTDRWAAAPVGEAKTAARLDRREDTDEPLGDPVAYGDRPGALVLAYRGFEVLPGPARSLGHGM